MERLTPGGFVCQFSWSKAFGKETRVVARDAEWRVLWEQLVSRFPPLAAMDQFAPPEAERGSIADWRRVEEALGFTEDDMERRIALSGLLSVLFFAYVPSG